MTVIVTSDLHVSENPRDEYRWRWLEKLPQLLRKEKAEALFILGDLTEQKELHTAGLVNRLVSTIHKIATICPVVILAGNHDGRLGDDEAFFGFTGLLERVSWVSRPQPLTSLKNVPESVSRRLRAIFLPYSGKPEKDWADIDFSSYDLAFTHQCYAGATSDTGFKLKGVSLSLLPKDLQIISGDVHTPQEFGNLIYAGSPYRINFGDEFSPRVLRIDKGEIDSVPCDGPMKFVLEVDKVDELAKYPHLNKEDILQVRVHIKADEYSKWSETVDAVRAWGAKKGFVIDAVRPIVAGKGQSMAKVKKAPTKSDTELVKEYAVARGVGEDTLKTGLKLI